MIPKIYLAGPIDNCTEEEIYSWRNYIRNKWPTNALYIDPCRRIDLQNYNAKNIVYMDKADIEQSNVLLANCWKPGWGTAQEIIWTFERGKLVVCVHPVPKTASGWIQMHCHHLTDNLDSAMKWILDYYNNLYIVEDDFDLHVRNC